MKMFLITVFNQKLFVHGRSSIQRINRILNQVILYFNSVLKHQSRTESKSFYD